MLELQSRIDINVFSIYILSVITSGVVRGSYEIKKNEVNIDQTSQAQEILGF